MLSKAIAHSDSPMDKEPRVGPGLPLNSHNKLQHQLPHNQKYHQGLAALYGSSQVIIRRHSNVQVASISKIKNPRREEGCHGERFHHWMAPFSTLSPLRPFSSSGELVNTMQHGQQLVRLFNATSLPTLGIAGFQKQTHQAHYKIQCRSTRGVAPK